MKLKYYVILSNGHHVLKKYDTNITEHGPAECFSNFLHLQTPKKKFNGGVYPFEL